MRNSAGSKIVAEIQNNGLNLTDLSGGSDHLGADRLTLTNDPDCLAQADIVLVTVKTGATAEIAELIKTQRLSDEELEVLRELADTKQAGGAKS